MLKTVRTELREIKETLNKIEEYTKPAKIEWPFIHGRVVLENEPIILHKPIRRVKTGFHTTAKSINQAIYGKDMRKALVEGFLKADTAVKTILFIQAVQGVSIIVMIIKNFNERRKV